jgi:prevent-host-death family protein
MKTITATDAKNKFGDLMNMIGSGPVSITKNNKVIAILSPVHQEHQSPSPAILDKLLSDYSRGLVARKDVEGMTGLWFGEVVAEMAKRGLSLPIVGSEQKFNASQAALFDRIFSS